MGTVKGGFQPEKGCWFAKWPPQGPDTLLKTDGKGSPSKDSGQEQTQIVRLPSSSEGGGRRGEGHPWPGKCCALGEQFSTQKCISGQHIGAHKKETPWPFIDREAII